MLDRKLNSVQKLGLEITLTSLFVMILFITAWLCDDSFITFRTVKNFINGNGLTWNIGERVQAYTHPLWMFIIAGFHFITREIYYTSLIVSIVISSATVLILLKWVSRSVHNSILVILILIFSKAFIDYSTSGLENPLTHLIMVVFFMVFFSETHIKKKLILLSLIASAALLNRMDTILLLFPALTIAYFKGNKLRGLLWLLTGFLPFLLWELFSLFYYGFPFPNTAYAKLNTGISQFELIKQGFHYFVFSLYLDPLTPFIILAGLLLPFLKKNITLAPISIGIALYLLYVLKIGGGFMGGRFFAAPLLCSVIIISKADFNFQKKFVLQLAVILLIIILGFLSPRPTVLSTANYGLGPKIVKAFRFGPEIVNIYQGIADERIWYYNNTGLLNNTSKQKIYEHLWVKDGLRLKANKDSVVVRKVIGLIGFFSDENVHIVDPLALSDALLSKLPSTEYWRYNWRTKEYHAYDSKRWRIGHFPRKIPDGYIETIASGKNMIQNKSLSKYYDKLSCVIKGNVFDSNRIAEIWKFNTKQNDYLLEDYKRNLTSNPIPITNNHLRIER